VICSTSSIVRSGPLRKGESFPIILFVNRPVTVSAGALSYTSPREPIEEFSPPNATVSVARIDVCWLLLSLC
jgi:hypothetical protein